MHNASEDLHTETGEINPDREIMQISAQRPSRIPALFHADAEPVLELVQRVEAAVLEGGIP